MSNEWPHAGHGRGMTPAGQGNVPFGPEVSRSPGHPGAAGYSEAEYHNGGYFQEPPTGPLPAASPSSHPYAAVGAAGYGDDGYSDPGYQGPAAQDAGIAGTRTVRGFVESGQGQTDYRDAGYAGSSYLPPAAGTGYGQLGYAGSSYA